MATDYPIEITDPDGSVRIAGLADFTDPDNQPASTNQPFQPASGDKVTIVEDSSGDDVLDYDDDENRFDITGGAGLKVQGELTAQGDALIGGGANNVGFFGIGPSAQPQVPATPLPQDIVDALVTLGLVTQAT